MYGIGRDPVAGQQNKAYCKINHIERITLNTKRNGTQINLTDKSLVECLFSTRVTEFCVMFLGV